MDTPLLTIAIPTFNRAAILARALQHLCPQLAEFAAIVDVIVSDNASIDNTSEVIKHYQDTYPDIAFVHHRNDTNVGFFGNAKVCRGLAHGKYLWLLSDDDFVGADILTQIIGALRRDAPAFVYLKNRSRSKGACHAITLTVEECILANTYELGLISSVIILNAQDNDAQLFADYDQNPFIGFMMLLDTTRHVKTSVVIEGDCLIGANAPHSVQADLEFFKVFVDGMSSVTDCMARMGMRRGLIRSFRRRYLINFLLRHYLYRKAGSANSGFRKTISEFRRIDVVVTRSYGDLGVFWVLFYPATRLPVSVVKYAVQAKRAVALRSRRGLRRLLKTRRE